MTGVESGSHAAGSCFSKGSILIVDDELHQRLILKEAAKDMGYRTVEVESGQKALEQLRFGHFDVLLTDLQMPNMDGLRLLENVRVFDPTVSVVMLTAHGSIETAVEAMKRGAEDYLQKPVEIPALEIVLSRVFERRSLARRNRELQRENEDLREKIGIRYHVLDSIGRSARAGELQEQIRNHMLARKPVLIVGEPGTGKDEIARMIHYNSPWSANSLILFDCAQVPEELHEGQLLGEETRMDGGVRIQSRAGLAERAHLGTLVVTNIDQLSKRCQPHFSRILREEKTQRVGGSRFYPVSTRFIAISAQPFEKISQLKERLRWDLYDLLKIPPLQRHPVPTLSDRADQARNARTDEKTPS